MPTDFDPTATGSWARPASVPTNSDFARLEEKVTRRIDRSDEIVTQRLDKITDALAQLITMQATLQHQERQIERLESTVDALQKNLSALTRTVEQWVNRGVGIWAVVGVAWMLWEKFHGG